VKEAGKPPVARASSRKGGADFYCGILADLSDQTNLWTMKAEAAEAFASLDLRPNRKSRP
jgi:hypothetical protein